MDLNCSIFLYNCDIYPSVDIMVTGDFFFAQNEPYPFPVCLFIINVVISWGCGSFFFLFFCCYLVFFSLWLSLCCSWIFYMSRKSFIFQLMLCWRQIYLFTLCGFPETELQLTEKVSCLTIIPWNSVHCMLYYVLYITSF